MVLTAASSRHATAVAWARGHLAEHVYIHVTVTRDASENGLSINSILTRAWTLAVSAGGGVSDRQTPGQDEPVYSCRRCPALSLLLFFPTLANLNRLFLSPFLIQFSLQPPSRTRRRPLQRLQRLLSTAPDTMLDTFEIVTTSGVVIWSRNYAPVNASVINNFIADTFIEEKSGASALRDSPSAAANPAYKSDQHTLKWTLVKELGVIFVVGFSPPPRATLRPY